jgi:hypothetical protein
VIGRCQSRKTTFKVIRVRSCHILLSPHIAVYRQAKNPPDLRTPLSTDCETVDVSDDHIDIIVRKRELWHLIVRRRYSTRDRLPQ